MPYFSSILHAPSLLCTISSIWKPNVLFFSLVRTAELWTSMSASYRMDKDYSIFPPCCDAPCFWKSTRNGMPYQVVPGPIHLGV